MDERDPADGEEPRTGIFIGLSAGAGSAGAALSAGMGAFEAFVNPAAARAREELEQQHERVIPTPSPGDRLLEDGVIVIEVADQGSDDSTIDRSSKDSPAP
ncbi:MAG: hypothetical protein GC156_08820 [Actinomycetales bacterium]|nr:hypothetical protein [Actinomycetales bacterium]